VPIRSKDSRLHQNIIDFDWCPTEDGHGATQIERGVVKG